MMQISKFTLLLLSGGSLIGQNIVQAIGARRDRFKLIATNSDPSEPSLLDFDEVHLVPETLGNHDYLEEVVRSITATSNVALIVPCRDDDVLFCAELAMRDVQLRNKMICGSFELARMMLDKEDSYHFSVRHALPFAACCSLDSLEAVENFSRDVPLPLIVKPKFGFASRKVTLVTQMSQLTSLVPNENLVAQEYLGDPERVHSYTNAVSAGSVPLFHSFEETKISLQTIIDPHGNFDEIFATQNAMRCGVSTRIILDKSRDSIELGERCATVFAREGWRGPLNIQCLRRPDGRLGIHEYNGRFTGATAARARLGYDEVQRALKCFAGLKIDSLFAPGSQTSVEKQPVTQSMPKLIEHQLSTVGHWRKGAPE